MVFLFHWLAYFTSLMFSRSICTVTKGNIFFNVYFSIWGGTPKHSELMHKNCVFILTRLNFSHLQSTLQLMWYGYQARLLFCCLKQLLNLSVWMPFSASAGFVSLVPHQGNISLWGLFHLGNRKSLRQDLVNREGGAGDMPFLVKNCWSLSPVWAGVL